jgi:WD40 repeat protein
MSGRAYVALAEAQFADDGGTVRIYWTEDDQLVLWSLGAGTWSIDPESGELSELDSDVPILWSPDGERRIVLTLADGTTTITLHEGDAEEPLATTALDGRVSHVRWSPTGDRVIFTLGRLASGGGILQDLMLWDLDDGVTPMRLTSSGAAFGVEWRGGQPLWRVN